MASLNKVMLIGNLTRDPELRYIPNGSAVADVSLAVNREWTDREGGKQSETCYVDIVAWRRLAEICDQYLSKGSLVFIEGRLQLDTWETQQGEKRSKHRVVASNMQLLDRKGRETGASSSEERRSGTPPEDVSHTKEGEDDIPF